MTQSLSAELTLPRYFAAAAIMGLLASQVSEPNKQWARDWAIDLGLDMAREVKKRGI